MSDYFNQINNLAWGIYVVNDQQLGKTFESCSNLLNQLTENQLNVAKLMHE